MSGPWNNQNVSLIILTEQTTGFSGLFGYSPTVALGNLIFSVAAKAGTDPEGNAYPQGLSVTLGSISGVTITGSTFTGTDFIINSSGEFFYSGTPAAGNLVSSVAPAAGADAFGNQFLAGPATYDNSGEIATALNAGFVAFYFGTLAGGWSALSSVSGDTAGNLQVNAGGELQLIGSSDVTINGSDQTSTATGSPVTSGPNGGVFAGHTHDFAGHTHTL